MKVEETSDGSSAVVLISKMIFLFITFGIISLLFFTFTDYCLSVIAFTHSEFVDPKEVTELSHEVKTVTKVIEINDQMLEEIKSSYLKKKNKKGKGGKTQNRRKPKNETMVGTDRQSIDQMPTDEEEEDVLLQAGSYSLALILSLLLILVFSIV